ncbi:MAG: transporter substrate-binding domain-containing protein [Desulfobacterales bacterium]|nr:transporter substrate-binding domain-containing protein [Desulfobacterales bacterium]
MKKIVFILTIVLILGKISIIYARSLEEIKKTKEIRFCLPYPDEPYVKLESENCVRDKCKFSGMFYEEAQLFTKSLGTDIKPKFIRIEWDEQFYNKDGKTVLEDSYTPEMLASGQCDCLPNNLTKNEWRQKKMDFVILFPSRMMVVINKSKKGEYKTVNDLEGKTVLVEKNTSYQTWIEEQNKAVFTKNPIKIEIMLEPQAKKIINDEEKNYFMVFDADVAIWSTRYEMKNSTVVFPVGPVDEIGWGFKKEDKDLQTAAQKFFEEQRKDPKSELNTIWKNFYGRTLTEYISLMLSVK